MSENLPEGYEYCTTWTRSRRHVSAGLKESERTPKPKGRGGRTLCGIFGEDQERVAWMQDIWSTGRQIVVAELPLCGLCAKRLAKVAAA